MRLYIFINCYFTIIKGNFDNISENIKKTAVLPLEVTTDSF